MDVKRETVRETDSKGKTVVVVWSRKGIYVMGSEAEVEMEEERQGDVG